LQNEYCIPPAKAKSRRRTKRGSAITTKLNDDITSSSVNSELVTTKVLNVVTGGRLANPYKRISLFVIILLIMLFIFNIILLMRLYKLEKTDIKFLNLNKDNNFNNIPNLASVKNLPNNHDDWIKLLKQQEILHETEMEKWHKILETAIELLNKVNTVCQTLIKNEKHVDAAEHETRRNFNEEL